MNKPRWPNHICSWKSRAQFSVRFLTIAIAILACVLGHITHRARVQRDAVGGIVKAGGWVLYDWGWGTGPPSVVQSSNSWVPRCVADILGADYFRRVVVVEFAIDASDQAMPYVGQLSDTESLNLFGSSVTDAGLRHVKGLTRLRHLALDRTAVTDDGLNHLGGLAHLELLGLSFTNVGNAGATHLTALKSLRCVRLEKTAVTRVGVSKLRKELPNTVLSLGQDGE